MRARVPIVLAAALLAASCSRQPRAASPTAPPALAGSPTPAVSPQVLSQRVTVRFGSRPVDAEVADEVHEQRTGLMHRKRLDDHAGMLFVFSQRRGGGFFMYNTLIPLSIAFLQAEGGGRYRVVDIKDMEPCASKDPEQCPTYVPGAFYDAALEVTQGLFEEWDVGVGATAVVDLR